MKREAATPGPEQATWQLKARCLAAVRQAAQQAARQEAQQAAGQAGRVLTEGEEEDLRRGWPCLLFLWQICEGAATTVLDWGDLLFCDLTTTLPCHSNQPPAGRASRWTKQCHAGACSRPGAADLQLAHILWLSPSGCAPVPLLASEMRCLQGCWPAATTAAAVAVGAQAAV